MGKSLVIVESPAKAKTINKYLGNEYVVKSSVGHIRDLPTSGSASKSDPKARAKQAALTRKMSPEEKVDKVYRVRLENALTREYISAFSEGMYFAFEDVMTRPAELEILSNKVARVTLFEGKYHQIKRMFGRFRNPVMALHRESIGNLILDEHLAPGQSRELSPEEVRSIAG